MVGSGTRWGGGGDVSYQPTYRPEQPAPPNATIWPVLRRWVLIGASVALFWVTAQFLINLLGQITTVSGIFLSAVGASIAIGIVVPVFLWVDRLESEPGRLLWFAFLWGALVSTAGALVLNQFGVQFFVGLQVNPSFAGPVLVAPIVEETLKGLGVLVLFVFARREFNGVTDGIAYAGLIAAGFAFVENLFYLGNAYTLAGSGFLWDVFIVRCLLSPFAHPLFTVIVGVAFGLVAHRRRSPLVWILPPLALVVAIGLHALWNFSAIQTQDTFFALYVAVQVPLFVGFIALILWARWRESRLLRRHLTGFGLEGWLAPAEVRMIASPRERRRARSWARSVGGARAEAAMTAFQDEMIALAVTRKHIYRGDDDPVWRQREATLLRSVPQHRAVFAGPEQLASARQLGRVPFRP